MDYRLVIAALSGALAACSALAQEKPATPPTPPREKKICRSQIVTGSIMRQSTCHARAQWAEIDAVNQRNADDSLSARGSGRPSRNGS